MHYLHGSIEKAHYKFYKPLKSITLVGVQVLVLVYVVKTTYAMASVLLLQYLGIHLHQFFSPDFLEGAAFLASCTAIW
jgi:hypothetical protein